MSELFDAGRAALGTISDESAKIALVVDEWRDAINGYTNVDHVNKAVKDSKTLSATMAPQVKTLIMAKAKALGFVWNPTQNQFVVRQETVGATA
jgi:hypothetical protein